MSSVILVHGKFPFEKIKKFVNQTTKIIALDTDAEKILQNNNIKYVDAYSYSSTDSNKNCVDWLNDWSCKKIYGDKTIKTVLLEDNFSYWWCMEQWLYYSFLYRDSFSKIIEFFDIILAIIQKENPKKIFYLDNGTLWGKVIKLIVQKKYSNISLKPIKISRSIINIFTEKYRPLIIKVFLRGHIFARKCVWKYEKIIQKHSSSKSKGSVPVVFAAETHRWDKVVHPDVPTALEGDPHILPITTQIRNAHVTYIDMGERNFDFNIFIKKSKSPDDRILLEKYYGLKEMVASRKIVKQLLKKIREIEKTKQFIESWDYKGINIWDIAKPQFDAYFTYRLEGHVRDYVSIKMMIEKEHPKMFIFPGESGELSYIFFKVCRENNIPCIGIQHGTLGYSSVVIHKKEEFDATMPESLPTPNFLLLYGRYYMELLSKKGNYPLHKIKIIGNVRFDSYKNKPGTKNALLKKYNVKKKRPVMLFITQILPFPSEEEIINRAIFNAAKKLGFELIVKLHPGEKDDSPYRKMASEIGVPINILLTAATNELVYISDLMIGFESTLNYEAMIYNIPIININFGKRKNWLHFVDKGAAFPVTSPEQVIPAIHKVMYDSHTRLLLEKNMKKVLFDDCYKMDGKAAQRAAHIVEDILIHSREKKKNNA